MPDSADPRPDPDALLAELQRAEREARPGRLFIFLGMSPGVGKTYAMLEAARQRQREGLSVLAALVETHGRSETAALLDGIETVPLRRIEHAGTVLEEMDLDAVLRIRPDLVLVDELAHTNAPGSRHAKRYQDVIELVESGLDVFTTLNVQHIESQVDIVRQISGVVVRERVPDSILELAHEIQLIDLSAEKLLARLAEGKVYLGERAREAAAGFFKESTLTALRELALRFTADRVDRDLEDIRRARRVSTPWKTHARLLVGIGPSPYAESLIRWTRRAATRLDCPWIVAWVESGAALDADQQDYLNRALALARRLGAEVVFLSGSDVATRLLELAAERNVSQIIVGKPGRARFRRTLADRIIAGSGEIDVCVVRPNAASAGGRRDANPHRQRPGGSGSQEYLLAVALAGGALLLLWALMPVTGYFFVALMLLLVVLVAGLHLRQGPILLLAGLAAMGWNFFFIPPHFTFRIQRHEDVALFVLFFVVALSMGRLTSRLRQRESAERLRQRETAALLRVTQTAALAAEPEKGLAAAVRIIAEWLSGEVALFVRQADRRLAVTPHSASDFEPHEKELAVLNWAFEHKQSAGRFTDTLPQSEATWFPLQTATSTMGVIGIRFPQDRRLDFETRRTIEAFAVQLGLVLEKEHFIQAMAAAEVQDQSDKLRRTLLDSVTHELKTPIAVMQAALDGRRAHEQEDDYLSEIRIASERMRRVVDQLLGMTRLESSVIRPHPDWCDLRDFIEQATSAAGPELSGDRLRVELPADPPPLRFDARLAAQALANVLHNAAVHTPPQTRILLQALLPGAGRLRLIIRDQGGGLPPGEERRIFEKFYRSPGSPPGGTGLGLAIARGLLRAIGGDIIARNRSEGGAEFVLDLPVETEQARSHPDP